MNPIPCAHCGNNFMRPTVDPEAPKLCNNCLIREEKRNPPKKENMEQTIDIKIKCPISVHNDIEEYCLNNGIDLTKYFLSLHDSFKQVQEIEIGDIVDEPLMSSEGIKSESKPLSHKSKKK